MSDPHLDHHVSVSRTNSNDWDGHRFDAAVASMSGNALGVTPRVPPPEWDGEVPAHPLTSRHRRNRSMFLVARDS